MMVMSYRDNSRGVWLDSDWERSITVDLPLCKATKSIEFEDDIIAHLVYKYGELMYMGDVHIGHDSHSANPFNSHLHFLKSQPHMKLALMGDLVEYATKTEFINEEVMMPDDQIDLIIKKLKPVADRIIWILYGNHEERFNRYTKLKRYGFVRFLADQLGLDESVYLGLPQRGVYAIIKAGKMSYGVYAHHSMTNARINKTLQLKRAGSQNVFSIIAQGHVHQMTWEPRTFVEPELHADGMLRTVRRQYLLHTGCFLKDPSYGEARSYGYTVVGAPVVRFYADKQKLDYYDLSQDYKEYLDKGGIPFGADTGVTDWSALDFNELKYGVSLTRLSKN